MRKLDVATIQTGFAWKDDTLSSPTQEQKESRVELTHRRSPRHLLVDIQPAVTRDAALAEREAIDRQHHVPPFRRPKHDLLV